MKILTKQQSKMKRVCKDIDITDHDLIVRAIRKCLGNKSQSQLQRPDIVNIFKQYGDEDAIADMMAEEIRNRKLDLKPVSWETRVDKSNKKERLIGVEDIKQQFYDNLAFLALEPLSHRIGEYQCSCLPNRGPVWGMEVILGWLMKGDIREIHQYDIRKNYASTDHEKLMAFLRKHVANDPLLWLIQTLLNTSPKGLIIGSVLSVMLDALYLSELYHYIAEDLVRVRHHKNGRNEEIHLAEHVMFNVDDFSIYCTSVKNAEMADPKIIKFARKLGYELHVEIRKNPCTDKQFQDIMGYRIYKDHVTMRRRNYIKVKRAIRNVNKNPTLKHCKTLTSMNGFVKHSDSYRFRKKYNVKKAMKKARKVVSEHDKSIICKQAASGADIPCRRSDDRPHLPERGRKDSIDF